MTLRSRTFAIFASVVALSVPGSVYVAHKKEFCISEWRKVSDKEIFLEAMAGIRGFNSYSSPGGESRGPYLEDNTDIQNLYVMMPNVGSAGRPKASTLLPSDERRQLFQTNYAGQDMERREKIAALLDDPGYRKRCCSQVKRDAENGGRVYTWFDVVKGKSEKIVRIRIDEAIADPSSFSPSLRKDSQLREQWQQTGKNTKISGPVRRRNVGYGFVNVDVCGRREIVRN